MLQLAHTNRVWRRVEESSRQVEEELADREDGKYVGAAMDWTQTLKRMK